MFGIKIIENHNLVKRVQFKFPKSKRKRIRKKFKKDQVNYRNEPDRTLYHMPNLRQIVCHPVVAAEIRRKVREVEK